MQLTDLLIQKKSSITAKWLQALFESYKPETVIFLKKEKDNFDNPVGARLAEGIRDLFAVLMQGQEAEQVRSCLDKIIRVRAVQSFSPAQALAFIFLLKNIIRAELAKELGSVQGLGAEVLEFESRIDGVALLGFDVYTQCREKLCEMRVTEVEKRVSAFLRKSGIGIDSL
jgi:hypothetical protein